MDSYISKILQYIGMEPNNTGIVFWLTIGIGTLFIFYGCAIFCHHILIPLVKKLTKRTSTKLDDVLLNEKALKHACDLIPAIIITTLLPLVAAQQGLAYIIAMKICWVYIIVASVRLVCTILSSLYILSYNSEKTKNHTLQGVFQMLKIVAICIGAIIVISTLIDKNPVTILAGLGASAAVLMLVFKDSIMGLVAGIQLSANDMLRPGDWIEMPKYGADGVVTDVTLTTVKIQNWDKTITTVPPYALVSESFQNWRGMWDNGGRRIKRSIYIDMNSIRLCSEEQIDTFIQNGWMNADDYDKAQVVNLTVFRNYLEEFLRNHKLVNSEMTLMVRQLQPTPQGLPLELYFFFDGINWVPYEHLQAEIFEFVFATLPRFGLRVFQSPTGSDINNIGTQATRKRSVSRRKNPGNSKNNTI
ncbi:MAG: mechanosensitive ion channel family protein [Bacteroidales bacterium]|nr:mechanosensitive ion channel family protein [Bacteroidales bacterium]